MTFWQRLKGLFSTRPPKTNDAEAWPHLRSFASSCLHQDADITGGHAPDARVFFGNIVTYGCQGIPIDGRQTLIAEIDTILVQMPDVSEDFLDHLGVESWTGDLPPREFLVLLRDLFVEHLDDPRAPSLPHDPDADPWGPMRRRRR